MGQLLSRAWRILRWGWFRRDRLLIALADMRALVALLRKQARRSAREAADRGQEAKRAWDARDEARRAADAQIDGLRATILELEGALAQAKSQIAVHQTEIRGLASLIKRHQSFAERDTAIAVLQVEAARAGAALGARGRNYGAGSGVGGIGPP